MKPPAPKILLILEDDALLRETLVETAGIVGFEVFEADTAAEGLRLAAAFRPSVVFCDVHLTKGDGRTVLARLREDPALADCQFVMMTGDWVGASQTESIALEADAYLAKPFTLDEFVACLEERYRQANL